MYTVINLACGAGGMALGFHLAGARIVLGIDSDPTAVQTFRVGPVLQADIRAPLVLPPANLVIGSVPGAGISLLNPYARGRDQGDPRNSLPYHVVRHALSVSPDVIVLDMVEAAVRSPSVEAALRLLSMEGYSTLVRVLDAAEFGVAQKRKHGVLIAMRGTQPEFPSPTHQGRPTSVREAIGDLPGDASQQDFAFPRNPTLVSRERYEVIRQGENWQALKARRPDLTPPCWLRRRNGATDVFGRLRWDAPALKIRPEFFKPEKGRFLHPEQHRPLTHREAARLQSFPDWYRICGGQAQSAALIGNAMPPRLAQAIGARVITTLAGAGVVGRG